jgi:PAS domain S-box-containing protein
MINQLFSYMIQSFMLLMQRTRLSRWVMNRWFSLSLYVQLMLGSGLLLIAVGSAAAFWNIAQQERSIIVLTEQQVSALAKTMAGASSSVMTTGGALAWQTMIQSASGEPTISRVALTDNNDNTIALSENKHAALASDWLIDALHQMQVLQFINKQVQFREPVYEASNNQVGWLVVDVDYSVLRPALRQLFLDNSAQAWFSIFTQILMLFFLLFLPALNFNRAVKFAQRIHNGQGETIETNGGARETTELIAALNSTSVLFSQQQKEILQINQNLEITVEARTRDLMLSKKQTDELIEYAPDVMIVADADGHVLRVNCETEQLFGYHRSELMGQSILMLLHEDIDNDFMAQLHHVSQMTLAERAINNQIHEYTAATKFGELVPIAVNFNAISNDTPYPTVVCSIRDITAEKRAQQALRDALTQAQAADRVKTQFLTTMSHEMRTPMNGVLGMASLLSQTGLSDQQSQYLNTILATGGSLLTIINDVLDFSQMEAGQAKQRTHTVNVQDLLKTVDALLDASVKEKSLTLTCHFEENTPKFIESDAGRIRQVLLHYVGNAIKFTEAGSISMGVARMVTEAGDMLRFTVTDTGIGIAHEKLESVFESFTQADATTTRKHEGTGIGLAICKQIAKLMSGAVGVVSREGEGSRFWFDIPCVVSTEAQTTQSATALVKPSETIALSGRVLLVEDNAINQKVAMAMLKKAGLTVDVAWDGVEGVKKYQEGNYDMIFMDCLMPNMDGFEATRAIRTLEQDSGKHIPISALTANALEDDRLRCKAAGMDAFVSKPINPGMLNEVLKKYLVY